ncbi:MAG: DUF1499 domain-containing protein [Rhizomicrobium sp.]
MGFLSVVGRLSFATFLVSLVTGLVASFGTRFGLWDYHVGLLKIFPFCLYFGIAAFVLGLAWVGTALIANTAAGARYGLIGFLGAIAVLAVPLSDFAQSYGTPPIHDISTDTEHAPQFVALLDQRQGAVNPPDYGGANLVAMNGKTYTTLQLQKKYYGDIHSIAILTTPEKLFDRALAAAKAMGWTIVAVAPDEGRIEATDTSFFFGMTSDIVIRVKPSGMGARVDIRSESRVGNADGGSNAAHIRDFVKRLLNG